MKTSKVLRTGELTGAALDWAVAKCESVDFTDGGYYNEINNFTARRSVMGKANWSTDWAQGGPIIEREKISVLDANGCWGARKKYWDNSRSSRDYFGPTPLIAAMRCYVASKMGDEVDIPKELI